MHDKLVKAGFTTSQANALIECFCEESKFAKHFEKSEFACKCGGVHCNGYPVEPDKRLITLLDDIRDASGTPCIISSGIRCERHNAAEGGVPNSYHKKGRAADFCLSGRNAAETLAYCRKFSGRYIELYAINNVYVHIAV